MSTLLETLVKPAPPPIATYEQMYGPMTQAEAQELPPHDEPVQDRGEAAPREPVAPSTPGSPSVRQGRFRRWFMREEHG